MNNRPLESLFRVPIEPTVFGDHFVVDFVNPVIALVRGNYAWRSVPGMEYIRLPGQLYVDDFRHICGLPNTRELACLEVETGRSRTLFAVTDDDVTFPETMKLNPTGLSDSHGKPIHIGDHIQAQVTCNTNLHGEWTLYHVTLRGLIPVLQYVRSERGQVLPAGYLGCLLSDKYELNSLLFDKDLASLRPTDSMTVIDICTTPPVSEDAHDA